jgi:formylglycine-generating enzyme required for sulfatase activity
MRKFLIPAFLFLIFAATTLYAAEVQNIKPSQVGNRILFEFDVEGSAGEETDVSITLTINGKAYTADKLHLEGDFGKTRAGEGKKIYWNVLQDFPRGFNQVFDYAIVVGGKEFTDPLTGMGFISVKGGYFQMGDTFGYGEGDEKPVHEVCVDDFYIGKYEVTQGQWKAVMGNNPSHFSSCGDN